MKGAIVYLHGFASSSRSTKAGAFAEHFEARGVRVECPDFNQPDFATLTITRMLGQLRDCVHRLDRPVTLVGSSLGGALAVLAAERMPEHVERLVLMAPAVMFARSGHHLLPPARVAEWAREGTMGFFHYGYGEERVLNYQFYEDSLRYDAFDARFAQPTLIFQGRHDASVDCRVVERFAEPRSNVTLTLLDDDHQLIASLPRILADVETFLGLGGS